VRRAQMREFRLFHLPEPGEALSSALSDERLAEAMRLPRDRALVYLFRGTEGHAQQFSLHAKLTLLGQSRLESTTGASAAYEETAAVVGYYDRNQQTDRMLDLWLLAVGLTPFSAVADRWHDRPPARLLPLSLGQRLLCALLHPLGLSCESTYQRRWDEANGAWLQEGRHLLTPAPGLRWRCESQAWIVPGIGVQRLRLELPGGTWQADLDVAIPALAP